MERWTRHTSQKHNVAVVIEDDASDLNIGSQCGGGGWVIIRREGRGGAWAINNWRARLHLELPLCGIQANLMLCFLKQKKQGLCPGFSLRLAGIHSSIYFSSEELRAHYKSFQSLMPHCSQIQFGKGLLTLAGISFMQKSSPNLLVFFGKDLTSTVHIFQC